MSIIVIIMISLFSAINVKMNYSLHNNSSSRRLQEKPHDSMNWSPIQYWILEILMKQIYTIKIMK